MEMSQCMAGLCLTVEIVATALRRLRREIIGRRRVTGEVAAAAVADLLAAQATEATTAAHTEDRMRRLRQIGGATDCRRPDVP